MNFYLGVHRPHWLASAGVPLFVSRRTLTGRRALPVAAAPWALDSGGFTELAETGRWSIGPAEYAAEVGRYAAEIGSLEWVAPQDWMCEPVVRQVTRKSTVEHQVLTVRNFQRLRELLGPLVVPVLQGWEADDYLRHVEMYDRHGVDLTAEALVGVGSVCRRQNMGEAARIIRSLAGLGLRLHAFGVKQTGLRWYGNDLVSADSMAWSYAARRDGVCSCGRRSGANCLHRALEWRRGLLADWQPSLWAVAV